MAYHLGDETIELTEPGYDAPPMLGEADERRLHLRAYHHWSALRRDGALPRLSDLDVGRLDGLALNSVLVDIAGHEPILRYVGERLRREAGLGGGEVSLAAVPGGSVLSRLTNHVSDAVSRRSPVRFEVEFTSARGSETLSRGVLMPLSRDGERVDALFGVISWKEVAAPELAGRLAAEMAAALGMACP